MSETITDILREMRTEAVKADSSRCGYVETSYIRDYADRIENAYNCKNEKLRALVKEMAEKLHSDYCCEDGSHFDGCDITDICHNADVCALVARAREAVKE